MIKIAFFSTFYNKGGAAIACLRLVKALSRYKDFDIVIITDQETKSSEVISLSSNFFFKIYRWFRFIKERLAYWPYEILSKFRYSFSPAFFGINPLNINKFQDFDIIHIHWINQGFLSLDSLKKIKASNKPVIFTLHDMWLFTGGCHYAGDCRNYEVECHYCPIINKPAKNDLSFKVWQSKKNLFIDWDFVVVTCSHWLKEEAIKSPLLSNKLIKVIPNPIDLYVFRPLSKKEAKLNIGVNQEKIHLLFGAMNINDERKGLYYLIEALKKITNTDNIEILIFGRSNSVIFQDINIPIKYLGLIMNQQLLVNLYNAADIFILPSLEDNLPNTVMEATACGVPTVAFDIGGLRDMIEHQKTGYLAKPKSSTDLANGIIQLTNLLRIDRKYFIKKCRQKVENEFSENIVANKYSEIYQSRLKP